MCGTLVPAPDAGAGPESPRESHAPAEGPGSGGASAATAGPAGGEQRGVAPSVPSFHAYIHAHAAAHDLRWVCAGQEYQGLGSLSGVLALYPYALMITNSGPPEALWREAVYPHAILINYPRPSGALARATGPVPLRQAAFVGCAPRSDICGSRRPAAELSHTLMSVRWLHWRFMQNLRQA